MKRQSSKDSTGHRPAVSSDRQPAAVEQKPVRPQPMSSCDDLQSRIAKRAYELHAERGYRHGFALEDWVEAERQLLGVVCSA